jgi:hypothetical protein
MTLRILDRQDGQFLQGVKNAQLAILMQWFKCRIHVPKSWFYFIAHSVIVWRSIKYWYYVASIGISCILGLFNHAFIRLGSSIYPWLVEWLMNNELEITGKEHLWHNSGHCLDICLEMLRKMTPWVLFLRLRSVFSLVIESEGGMV